MVAFDSNILIYFLDDASPFFDSAQRLLERVAQSQIPATMSVLARTEILNLPYRISADDGVKVAAMLDTFDMVTFTPVTSAVADRAAALIGKIGPHLKNADALHLASALEQSAHEFYTNDKQLLSLGGVDNLRILGL